MNISVIGWQQIECFYIGIASNQKFRHGNGINGLLIDSSTYNLIVLTISILEIPYYTKLTRQKINAIFKRSPYFFTR